jgi:hypothetical protein
LFVIPQRSGGICFSPLPLVCHSAAQPGAPFMQSHRMSGVRTSPRS